MKKLLEVCVDSVESAMIAQEGGADRLEVCSNLVIGGTTPGVSQFKQIRKACNIKLNVLIRPRFGDFLYTEPEFLMIAEDIRMFRELGADGVVVGCLTPDGRLDVKRMQTLRDCAGDLHMTLHRAFDVCQNPDEALRTAISLKIDTILTSGQEADCVKGKAVLKRLIRQAGEDIEILVGSGVDAAVIRSLSKEIHATSFHMSGKEIKQSGMTYRNERVNMGMKELNEFEIFRTAKEAVVQAREALDLQ